MGSGINVLLFGLLLSNWIPFTWTIFLLCIITELCRKICSGGKYRESENETKKTKNIVVVFLLNVQNHIFRFLRDLLISLLFSGTFDNIHEVTDIDDMFITSNTSTKYSP